MPSDLLNFRRACEPLLQSIEVILLSKQSITKALNDSSGMVNINIYYG